MKVSGFTFIKNAVIYDYPIVEAIKSILPICNEVVVAVGKSDDDTLNLIKSIDKHKIKIVETEWDESLRQGGKVLACETDKAFAHISKDADWAFYIQGDEVVHEKYLDTIYNAMQQHKNSPKVDGLLFKYVHFYGSYSYVGASSNWYKNEIRVIKNNKNIFSYKDAQGFRKNNNQKLNVFLIDAYIYHYGWVKEPKAMQKKQENFNKYWHNDQWMQNNIEMANEFDYTHKVKELKAFEGTHPSVMQKRIDQRNWHFDFDEKYNKKSIKDKIKHFAKNYFNIDLAYKNYVIVNAPYKK